MSERDPSSPPSWHSLSVKQVGALLSSSGIEGLAPDEAAARLRHYGPNVITERRRRHAGLIFLAQFSDFMVLVLATAAILAGVIGEPQDTVAIVAILVLNAVLGFVQEYRAERALESLRAISVPAVRVRRGRMTTVVPGTELVPGDLVLLEAGNLVPVDLPQPGDLVGEDRQGPALELEHDEAAITARGARVGGAEDLGQVDDGEHAPALVDHAREVRGRRRDRDDGPELGHVVHEPGREGVQARLDAEHQELPSLAGRRRLGRSVGIAPLEHQLPGAGDPASSMTRSRTAVRPRARGM